MLRESQASLLSIADKFGYDFEAGFVRVLKWLVGVPPATWRREHGHQTADASETCRRLRLVAPKKTDFPSPACGRG
jgi:AraC-like DNA-binding protein